MSERHSKWSFRRELTPSLSLPYKHKFVWLGLAHKQLLYTQHRGNIPVLKPEEGGWEDEEGGLLLLFAVA